MIRTPPVPPGPRVFIVRSGDETVRFTVEPRGRGFWCFTGFVFRDRSVRFPTSLSNWEAVSWSDPAGYYARSEAACVGKVLMAVDRVCMRRMADRGVAPGGLVSGELPAGDQPAG